MDYVIAYLSESSVYPFQSSVSDWLSHALQQPSASTNPSLGGRLESVRPRTNHSRETARCSIRVVVVPSEHIPRVKSSSSSATFIGGFFLRIQRPSPPYCCGVPRNSDHCHRVRQHVSTVAPHRCHSRVRGRRRCLRGNGLEENTFPSTRRGLVTSSEPDCQGRPLRRLDVRFISFCGCCCGASVVWCRAGHFAHMS